MFIILSSIFSGDIYTIMMSALASIVVVFTALPIHEVAHGFVASKLGDPTAKNLGRLNLNPLAHFDMIGTTMLLLFGFGWAKPVPVNPYYFKNRKNGMAITALAGPMANIILAWLCYVIYKVIYYFVPAIAFTQILTQVLILIVNINITLAAFNLIPLPPLDGSKIVGIFLPMNIYYKYENFMARYQNIVLYALMAALFILPRLGSLGQIIYAPMRWIQSGIYWVLNFTTGFVDLIAKII